MILRAPEKNTPTSAESFLKPFDWLNLAVKTITEDTPGEATYYAERDRTWFHMTVDKTRNGRCIFTLSNVSELKKKEKQLTDLVYTDQLTGLSNRTCFNEVFDMTIEASLKNGERIGAYAYRH
jgi:predicted signal transduction protein with EAL and GGDEF domain